jgi:hypothetical protein
VPKKWPGMTGDLNLVRIGASTVGNDACPEQQAAKARPAMRPAVRARARTLRLNDFPLGLVMGTLDDIEFRGESRESALARLDAHGETLHRGALRWARHAVEAYLAGAAQVSTEAVTAVPRHWIAQQVRVGKTWELYSWGRRYESADGSCREFRFIRYGSVGDGRDPAEVALAAYTTAYGRLGQWPDPWPEPFNIVSDAPVGVRQVRVLEVSLLDGGHKILFDGTPRGRHCPVRDGRALPGASRQRWRPRAAGLWLRRLQAGHHLPRAAEDPRHPWHHRPRCSAAHLRRLRARWTRSRCSKPRWAAAAGRTG